ncbi:hypothetical protein Prum_010550 [Phytohabitans rumicis]|uniref:Uncharacterized protein n=1 Tax=Phytohabitans rumicis TaxID=1076125 RepID=A0A6V8KQF4_9ACTN|nr:hypothetical protein Prum_010550 [Phytohabitans rumicis]
MPTAWAIVSAVLNPIPHTSDASRYGSLRTTDALQEDHHLLDGLLLLPGLRDHPGALRPETRHLHQPARVQLKHGQTFAARIDTAALADGAPHEAELREVMNELRPASAQRC